MRSSPGLPEGAWGWLNDLARWIGTWCFVPFFRLRVHRRERVPRTGPVVVVANHSAFVDGPLLYGLLGRRAVFLVKDEMFRGPLGYVLPRMGQLAVRRGTVDRRPLMAALDVLRGNGMVVVFPEGTRGTGEVAAARHGAAWLARQAQAPLLPVACRGTARPSGGKRRLRPRVDVLVGDPLPTPTGRGRAELAEATEGIRTALVTLVADVDEIRVSGQ
ncbi:lysophospholipid acyltransferase family protein [Pseudonocardia endophytica]|uniref:1-acyl-sn-glycerol-3-phosphate acyltransferase n=1 Tax=Pseudonocardia endophytica TaxID=401976 RepID=A0A4R1HX87_PSEEN|nr:lysophospholipid acyltransferase family protein [Pseudonocardia endophytica]TCK24669.1 1-acyl-sn-glycerol-3-phosphate acyltransferase [Pseudonocardia endophytica]